MTIKTGAIKAGGSEVYPHTALDQIRKSATSSTTLIASGGVIKKAYLDLTGLISSSYVSSANIIPASAINGLSTAVNNAASTYVNSSGIIPASAINGLPTAVANAASTYVNSSDVIPTSAVVGLPLISSSYALFEENGWTRWVSAGAGVIVTENSTNFPERDVTIGLRDYDTIETLSGNTVVISPGKYYRLDATTGSKTISINTFGTTQWGRESYMELFVANTGYVVTNAKVVLTAPLEPNSVNNCVIKFRNGLAFVSVEDHIGGYIVISSGSGSSTSGTLAYGVKSSTSTYIAFNGALNSATISFGGVTANGVKRIVGNGYDATTLTGSVNCGTGECTVRNLSLQNVGIMGGTMTLGDVHIPSNSTVAVSGGGLAVEKVTGAGDTSVIDFGGTANPIVSSYVMSASSCTFTGGKRNRGGAFYAVTSNGSCIFSGCTFSGNSATDALGGGALAAQNGGILIVSSCTFVGNKTGNNVANAILQNNWGSMTIADCSFAPGQGISIWGSNYTSRRFVLQGSNKIDTISTINATAAVTVTISPGAIIDLTSNTNTTPIAPGGGIAFGANVTVINSAGQSVLLNSGSAGTCNSIKKDGTTT